MFNKVKEDLMTISIKVWIMLFISFVITLTKFMILPFLAIYFSRVINFSSTEIGILLGTPAFAATVFSFFSGLLADKIGVKKTLSIGGIITGLGYVCYGLTESFWILLFVSAIVGVSWNMQSITLDSYITKIVNKKDLNKIFGYKYWGTNLGGMIGPIIGAYIDSGNSSDSLYIVAMVLLILSLLIFLFKEEKAVVEEVKNSDKIKIISYFEILLRDKALIYLTLATVCAFLIESQITSNINQYIAISFEDGVKLFAHLLFVSAISVVILQPIITYLTSKIIDKIVFIIGTMIFLLAPIIFIMAETDWLLYIGIITLSVGEMILAPREESLLAKIANNSMTTTYFSISRIGSNIGFTLGPVIGGYLFESFNKYGLFLMIMIIMVLYANFLLLSVKHANQQANKNPNPMTSSSPE